MLYTLTCNPSIDYYLEQPTPIEVNRVNRARETRMRAGGKGINVARELSRMGVMSEAVYFAGGVTGEWLSEELAREGVPRKVLPIGGETRINVKLTSSEGDTEIGAPGPEVSAQEWGQLMAFLETLGEDDCLVMAGNAPRGAGERAYGEIAEMLCRKGVPLVVDAQGSLLTQTLGSRPKLIKPNAEELGEIFGRVIETAEDARKYGRKLQEAGAENVIVSMGAVGAVMVTEEGQSLFQRAYPVRVRSAVGAGDAFLGAYLGARTQHNTRPAALDIAARTAADTIMFPPTHPDFGG